jgi:hypothetical protein
MNGSHHIESAGIQLMQRLKNRRPKDFKQQNGGDGNRERGNYRKQIRLIASIEEKQTLTSTSLTHNP